VTQIVRKKSSKKSEMKFLKNYHYIAIVAIVAIVILIIVGLFSNYFVGLAGYSSKYSTKYCPKDVKAVQLPVTHHIEAYALEGLPKYGEFRINGHWFNLNFNGPINGAPLRAFGPNHMTATGESIQFMEVRLEYPQEVPRMGTRFYLGNLEQCQSNFDIQGYYTRINDDHMGEFIINGESFMLKEGENFVLQDGTTIHLRNSLTQLFFPNDNPPPFPSAGLNGVNFELTCR